MLQLTPSPFRTCAWHQGQCRAPFTAAKSKASKPQQQCASTRRETIAGVVLAPLVQSIVSVPPSKADEAATASAQQYLDQADSFSLTIPTGWESAEGQIDGNRSFQGSSGARRTLVWYPAGTPADQVNVTLTITNTSVEFTGLGSFGNVFAFGTNLVNSMDRSFLLRVRRGSSSATEPVQIAKLVDAKETRGMYFVEYTVEKQPGPKRHLYSLVALRFNGYYNRLYTLTAQCLEEQVDQVEPVLKQMLGSFAPPARTA